MDRRRINIAYIWKEDHPYSKGIGYFGHGKMAMKVDEKGNIITEEGDTFYPAYDNLDVLYSEIDEI